MASKVRQTLTIKTVKGSRIAEAVQKAAKQPVIKENDESGSKLYELGQDSMYGYENFKLAHPTGTEFHIRYFDNHVSPVAD